MKLTKPEYYDTFRCLAGACPDSCCQEWDVDIDEETATLYRSLPGPLGDTLRRVLTQGEYGTVMTIENRRCPMWRQDGLCRIQAELGEGALSRVCRSFPRLSHDYGSFRELGLELSCPEAARLILASPFPREITEEAPESGEPDFDEADMELLLAGRREARALLAWGTPGEALAAVLLHSCGVQAQLDGGEKPPFSPESVRSLREELGQEGELEDFYRVFRELEILTPRWETLLASPRRQSLPEETRGLARYFLDRYYLQAVSDLDLLSRVKLMLISCLAVGNLPGTFLDNAQLYSKEIENDPDNLDALLDAAYTREEFTDGRLLAMLLPRS